MDRWIFGPDELMEFPLKDNNNGSSPAKDPNSLE